MNVLSQTGQLASIQEGFCSITSLFEGWECVSCVAWGPGNIWNVKITCDEDRFGRILKNDVLDGGEGFV